MLHGIEARPVRKENKVAVQRAEMSMVGRVALSYKVKFQVKG